MTSLTTEQVKCICEYGNTTCASYLRASSDTRQRDYATLFYHKNRKQCEALFIEHGLVAVSEREAVSSVKKSNSGVTREDTKLNAAISKINELQLIIDSKTEAYDSYKGLLQTNADDYETMKFIAFLPNVLAIQDQNHENFSAVTSDYKEYQRVLRKDRDISILKSESALKKSKKILLNRKNASNSNIKSVFSKSCGDDAGAFIDLLSYVKQRDVDVSNGTSDAIPSKKVNVSFVSNSSKSNTTASGDATSTKSRSSRLTKSPFKKKTGSQTSGGSNNEKDIDLSD